MNLVPAAEVVHVGLVMDLCDKEGLELQGVVETVVWDGSKPVAVILKTGIGLVTIPLKGVKVHKYWTIH